MLVDELLQEDEEAKYVEDSEDDLDEWQQQRMNDDEEFHTLMDFVFGPESDDDWEQIKLYTLYYDIIQFKPGFYTFNQRSS